MYLGKVIGTVVSTIKTPSLTGSKFLPSGPERAAVRADK